MQATPSGEPLKRLAIMGGTFDPIHYGHLLTAEEAREHFALDQVVFVPNGRPVFKKAHLVSSPEHRYAICCAAIASNPAFTASRIEIEREGPSYAIDTVRHFRALYPDLERLYFITGADVVLDILTWHEYDHLIAECEFIAATRPGFALDRLSEVLRPDLLDQVHFLSIPGLDISSTELRKRVHAGRGIRYLTPPSVRDYIEKHGLYQAD